MAFLCTVGRHATRSSNVCNQGLYFSSCARCGRDMIGSEVKWKPVPRDKRIVWRTVRRAHTAGLAAIRRNLPMVIAQKNRRKKRIRARFAEFVSMDLPVLAWSGANGLRLWRSKLAARFFEQRSRSSGQLCFALS